MCQYFSYNTSHADATRLEQPIMTMPLVKISLNFPGHAAQEFSCELAGTEPPEEHERKLHQLVRQVDYAIALMRAPAVHDRSE